MCVCMKLYAVFPITKAVKSNNEKHTLNLIAKLQIKSYITYVTYVFFFYSIINHKQILTKYYNHQEHTYCYLGDNKNTMLEHKLMEQITKIKILKEKRKVKN